MIEDGIAIRTIESYYRYKEEEDRRERGERPIFEHISDDNDTVMEKEADKIAEKMGTNTENMARFIAMTKMY